MNPKDIEMFREKLKQTDAWFLLAENQTTGIAEIVHIDSFHGILPADLAACPVCKDMPEDSDLATLIKNYKYTIN
jgi:hypothetical protein